MHTVGIHEYTNVQRYTRSSYNNELPASKTRKYSEIKGLRRYKVKAVLQTI